ncbi:tRNA pseudouridine(55) synthase TruB [candidate division WWE3 bacterium RIFCSPHIGHO2_01_FULL_40_23]|uniref:tRNA pseudouridine synthase B n=1 Tax=candidate division WWE3 bacterium RIFCSPLOWO2_01_FULL_41_18 TaxID=1802625 RepID=A0A1F4VDM2_UNCKA|nr:MAG: tRNA pseudouridine(55) synthase TruB [candidate division WWE3 bacterium RIFCSPHIGHO2_01_FULL_40_23]OGC55376.1 MAG: tRNA pseudouridine(55) synthase TruB [candidate division WWE3 bacterium RIFCSPLOWO2_01_FULL_41_18]
MGEVLNVFKPKGFTSFDVVKIVKEKLGVRKAGHAGTLDPMAEGVLIVLTDEETKNQNSYMHLEKEYYAGIAFGIETDTYDLEGKITCVYENPETAFKAYEFNEVISSFLGKIKQVVPFYSAVKVKGRRLYDIARSGVKNYTALPVREVEIKDIKVEGFEVKRVEKVKKDFPVLSIRVVCQSGTYIRSLAHDLGKKMGTGATLIKLVRTMVGKFKVEDSLNLDDL